MNPVRFTFGQFVYERPKFGKLRQAHGALQRQHLVVLAKSARHLLIPQRGVVLGMSGRLVFWLTGGDHQTRRQAH